MGLMLKKTALLPKDGFPEDRVNCDTFGPFYASGACGKYQVW